MSFSCDLLVSGVLPEDSARAFIKSYNETSKMEHYKSKMNYLSSFFQNKLERNIAQAGIRDPTVKSSFSVKIENNQMIFSSDNFKALSYEYGAKHLPPRRYLQPSIIETANEMSSIILNDAVDIYNQNIKTNISINRNRPNLIKNNKYSQLLQ